MRSRLLVVYIASVFAAALVAGAAPVWADATPMPKVLMLGFSSKTVNDIQDRLLRETALRSLLKRGVAIVAIMELEEYLLNNPVNVRAMNDRVIAEACDRLDAACAITGQIEVRGPTVRATVRLYRRGDKKFVETAITVDGAKNFNEYCPRLADKIAAYILAELPQKR